MQPQDLNYLLISPLKKYTANPWPKMKIYLAYHKKQSQDEVQNPNFNVGF
jgi:hypothetical protein